MTIDTASDNFYRARRDFFIALGVTLLLNFLGISGLVGYLTIVFGWDFMIANVPPNLGLITVGFLTAISISLVYARDLIAFFVHDPDRVLDEYSLDRLRRKILNLPIVFAGLSFLVRTTFGSIVSINIMQEYPQEQFRIFTHVYWSILFAAISLGIYVFYFAESILSENAVPFLMNDKKVSSVDGVIPMAVYMRIIILIVSTAVVPMLHISFLNYLGESKGATLGFALISVFINGFGQGIFIVKSISIPIGKIAGLFTRFKQGDDVHNDTDIYRADDLGRFAEMFDDLTETIEERDFIRQTFGRYMSQQVMEEILNGQIELGGSRMNATVLFADIRDFTSISESKPPEEVVDLLNNYLEYMVQAITTHDGIPDKFLGDGILAVWGVPAKLNNHQQKAVEAGFDMLDQLQSFNTERRQRGNDPLSIGIGIHSGELIAGNIGSNKKMEFTVVGDTVNTCSRIEAVNKTLDSTISISNSVFSELERSYKERFRSAPEVDLKGKNEIIDLYTVKDEYRKVESTLSDTNG